MPTDQTLERFMRDAHILARLVEQILERGYLRRAAPDDVTFDQVNILKFLSRPQPVLVKHVAAFLNASYAAASKAVTRLEKKGLVQTEPYGPDRRAEVVEVTPEGRRIIRAYERYKQARLKSLLAGHAPDRLAKGLEAVIAVLLRERGIAGHPCLGCGAYYARRCVSREYGQPCPRCP
ncbi:MAG: winged helix-turn-helix transcriptional regulator [Planctomycetes bacterium]|nr:winged helix-turn-helix transcriptional regulator [Planctomycetota bacterium]